MKKNFKTIIGVLAVCVVAFASCKKKKSQGPADYLPGNWKVSQSGFDANANGAMDAGEMMADTTNTTATFNANGTGTVSINFLGTPFTLNLTWKLINSNTWLQIISTSPIGGGTDTSYSQIESLTSSAMTLKDTAGGTASWTIFAKQ